LILILCLYVTYVSFGQNTTDTRTVYKMRKEEQQTPVMAASLTNLVM